MNHMVQVSEDRLDSVFGALSDRTRREVLEALGEGDQTVSDLAQPHDMSLTGFMKHLRVLQDAGVIACVKEGRVVRCALSAAPMQQAIAWIAHHEKFWTGRLDALARYLYQQEALTPWQTRTPPRSGQRSRSPETTTRRPKKSGARGPSRKR